MVGIAELGGKIRPYLEKNRVPGSFMRLRRSRYLSRWWNVWKDLC